MDSIYIIVIGVWISALLIAEIYLATKRIRSNRRNNKAHNEYKRTRI